MPFESKWRSSTQDPSQKKMKENSENDIRESFRTASARADLDPEVEIEPEETLIPPSPSPFEEFLNPEKKDSRSEYVKNFPPFKGLVKPRRRAAKKTQEVVEHLGEGSNSKIALRALSTLGAGGTKEGNATFLAVMSADPKQTPQVQKFILEAQKTQNEKHSVMKIAEGLGTPVGEIFLSYARGIQTLGQAMALERVAEVVASRMEAAIESLAREAIPKKVLCKQCEGHGKYGRHKLDPCKPCRGSGFVTKLSTHWAFAQKQFYTVAGVVEKQAGLTIQQTNQTSVKSQTLSVSTDLVGKMIALSDAIIHTPAQGQLSEAPVDAELIDTSNTPNVFAEINSTPTGEASTESLPATGEARKL